MPTPLDKCEQMIVELREKIKSFSEKSTLLDKLPKEIESLSEKFALIAQTSTKDEINALEKKLDSILKILQETFESQGDRYFQAQEYNNAVFEYEKAVKLGKTTVQAKLEESQTKAQEAQQFKYLQLGPVKLELVEIPGKSWLMGKYPVTQEQYEALMNSNPSQFKGIDRPVECVSWNDAQEFCRKASAVTGKQVRLPSEIEWEYAARAGTTTTYFFGNDAQDLDKYAWYKNNSNNQTHPVGTKEPNPWGLYDMLGNVEECCQDWYNTEQTNKPVRGGKYSNPDYSCKCAFRTGILLTTKAPWQGFRVVVVI
jgi:formylglycine-generating enzyme required for sulfatase activity